MPVRKNAKIALLRQIPLFAQCGGRELEEIAAIADELSLPEGRELTREGEAGREFVAIVAGEAVVRRQGRTIATLREGDFFGEMALVTGRPRNATVVAATPLRTLVIVDRAFRSLLERSPAIQAMVLRAVAERVPADET